MHLEIDELYWKQRSEAITNHRLSLIDKMNDAKKKKTVDSVTVLYLSFDLKKALLNEAEKDLPQQITYDEDDPLIDLDS